MALISTLVRDIISDIPEIPGFVAERQYLRAARELCEKARVWREDVSLSTTANISTYSLVPRIPEYTELVDIISIKPGDGSAPIAAKTQSWLDTNVTDWRNQTALTAKWYMLTENNTIRLVPTPSDVVTYQVRLALKPLLGTSETGSQELGDVVVNKYSELLVSGAKAYLFMTPRKPWTDLNLAQYHQAMFQAGIPEARSEAADEFQTGVARKVKYGGI